MRRNLRCCNDYRIVKGFVEETFALNTVGEKSTCRTSESYKEETTATRVFARDLLKKIIAGHPLKRAKTGAKSSTRCWGWKADPGIGFFTSRHLLCDKIPLTERMSQVMNRHEKNIGDPTRHEPPDPPPTRRAGGSVVNRRAMGEKVHSGKGKKRGDTGDKTKFYKEKHMPPRQVR